MNDPIVEARLKALEDQFYLWRKPVAAAWNPKISEAPHGEDILATIVGASGQIRVATIFHREAYSAWSTITGQRVSEGAVLAWMPMPAPYKVPPLKQNAPKVGHE